MRRTGCGYIIGRSSLSLSFRNETLPMLIEFATRHFVACMKLSLKFDVTLLHPIRQSLASMCVAPRMCVCHAANRCRCVFVTAISATHKYMHGKAYNVVTWSDENCAPPYGIANFGLLTHSTQFMYHFLVGRPESTGPNDDYIINRNRKWRSLLLLTEWQWAQSDRPATPMTFNFTRKTNQICDFCIGKRRPTTTKSNAN